MNQTEALFMRFRAADRTNNLVEKPKKLIPFYFGGVQIRLIRQIKEIIRENLDSKNSMF